MDGWDRVAAAVVDRRSELGLTQKDLASKAAVAERTIQNLESGRRLQALVRARVERALGWEQGEFRRIAEAQREPDPYPFVPSLLRKDIAGNGELTPAEKDVVLAAIDAALRAEQGGVPAPGRAPRRARDAERRSAS